MKAWANNRIAKIILVTLGFLSLMLGIIGVFLPLLPTTPFLLLTAFCFAHGSERLYSKLISIPKLGRPIQDWHEHGRIRRSVKIIASMTLVTGGALAWIQLEKAHLLVIASLWTFLGMVLLFIWSRPE